MSVESKAGPVASVVVLTYNGGTLLRRVAERLCSQQIDGELEILFVDSGSTDGSERLDEDFPIRMIRIPKESFSFGYARSLGFEQATGDCIATISQDYLPCNDAWLRRLIAPLQQGADVTLGRGMPHPGKRPFYWETRRFAFTGESGKFNREHGGLGFSCMCLATRRDVWSAAGFGPDTPMSEDKYFQKAAWEAGYRRYVYVPEACGYHAHDYDLTSLWKRCENEGFGWRRVGVTYGIPRLVVDLFHLPTWAKLGIGIVRGQVRDPGELLFPWVRPLAVFRGNRWNEAWKR